jgi:hypothetical protein
MKFFYLTKTLKNMPLVTWQIKKFTINLGTYHIYLKIRKPSRQDYPYSQFLTEKVCTTYLIRCTIITQPPPPIFETINYLKSALYLDKYGNQLVIVVMPGKDHYWTSYVISV